MLFSAEERYRPTSVYRNLVHTQTISPTNSHEQFRLIPNHQKTGNTWDVRHLDKFLDTPWGTKTPAITTLRPGTRGVLDPMTQTEKTDKSGKTKANSTRNLTNTQGSFFFNNGPRFTADREKAYLINFAKDFTIKETKNNVNTLVTNVKLDDATLKKYCDKELTGLRKSFDPSRLEFSHQANALVTPEENRRAMLETKINQKEMAKWKERNKEITKKYRVYKRGFKSGIVGLDNPTNEDTLLYREENEALQRKTHNIAKIEERRFNQLHDLTKSNSAVEFFNRNFDKKTSFPPKQIVARNARQQIDMEHTARWKDSTERIFGEPERQISVDRAFKLRAEETKGRGWNIISSANNTVIVNGIKNEAP